MLEVLDWTLGSADGIRYHSATSWSRQPVKANMAESYYLTYP